MLKIAACALGLQLAHAWHRRPQPVLVHAVSALRPEGLVESRAFARNCSAKHVLHWLAAGAV